jgi:hypothetical protein
MAPVLRQPDFAKKFFLQTDASSYGLGAVLSQEGELEKAKGKPILHPIVYYSATFTPTECNYDIYERELLAVMKSLAHWRPYLGWTKEPFTIITNHTNLQYWKSPQNLNCRTAQWHTDLQEYDFNILYMPGKTNVAPDALSQPPGADHGENDNQSITMLPESRFNVATVDAKDKTLVPPLDVVKRGIMRLMHDLPMARHLGRDETLRKTQEWYYWPGMKNWISEYIKGCATCQQNKILTHKQQTPIFRIPMEENTRPFQRVTMDLITGLPPIDGKDAILTIVDQGCSRVAIFLPCNMAITGPGVAKLYHDYVFRWFGLPNKIISNRDP